MMDVGRHPNIALLTYSELVELKGKAGNFKAKVLKKASMVDQDKCTACGECEKVCPVDIPSKFNEGLGKRKAIYRPFPQAVPNTYTISRKGLAPCQAACGVHQNAQGYIQLITQGKYKEALDVILRDNPLPSICGRVCTHPCMTACTRQDVDESLNIRGLKRYITDYNKNYELPKSKVKRKEKIAIIGSGPAGLMAAYKLRQMGYKPTIFEALSKPGGMLSAGIPEFRLPEKMILHDIKNIEKTGVEIRLNTAVGKDISFAELQKEYKAVFIAIGAHLERKLYCDGESLAGIMHGIEFLHNVNFNLDIEIGKKVLVVGGGNSAIDAARTALRMGAEEVTVVYRRSKVEMPADPAEIDEAEEEGIKFYYLAAPKKFSGNGKVKSLECIKMRLGKPDESGRRRPIPIDGSEFTLKCDNVIVTIGQFPDIVTLGEKHAFKATKEETVIVDPVTMQTNIPGVFAGGDCVTGPDMVVNAMYAGKKAAISIDRYINKIDMNEGRKFEGPYQVAYEVDTDGISHLPATVMPSIDLSKRTSWEEVHTGYEEEMAVREAERCLACADCCDCQLCSTVCEPKCIDYSDTDKLVDLNLGSIIVATGIDYFNPSIVSEFGYTRFKNVVTSLEIERLLSSSGPSQGELIRLSDNESPGRIAFIQCVASRDLKIGNPYCSTICCMNAIKDAQIIREHYPETKIDIFYIDIRAFGKGYEGLYCHSIEDKNITYIRTKPSKILEDPKSHDLKVMFEDPDTGQNKQQTYGMVVLSSALVPAQGSSDLAKILGIQIDNDGFYKQKDPCAYPLDSEKDGIYLAGCALGPKDITDSIAEASGAAVRAAKHVLDQQLEREDIEIPQIDTSGEARVGVFVCQCGINISGVVDTEQVVEYANTLPNVVHTADVQFACAASTQTEIQQSIIEHRLNRFLVAACTPKTHEPIFQETLAKIGLNPYLFEMVNIRDQCSWVHIQEPERATQKAKDLVRMGVAKARLLNPLDVRELEINHDVMVIGSGVAGIQAAIDLVGKGFKVYLIEKEKKLGGRVSSLTTLYPSYKPGLYFIESKLNELKKLGVQIYSSTKIDTIKGFVGNFEVMLKTSKNGSFTESSVKVGAIVVAAGADLYGIPEGEFGYGIFSNVYSNQEFEDKVFRGTELKLHGKKPKTVAYVQCVGSRGEKGNPDCSRYCCQAAIKQAIALREAGIQVVIFHRDIRVYSRGAEEMYRRARGLGVLFIHYDKENPPQLKGEGKVSSIVLGNHQPEKSVEYPVDAVVLSLGMVPNERESDYLVQLLKIPRGSDRFFMERHPKLGPVETAMEGIFLCGCAQGPKDIADSISQASAVAAKVSALLSNDTITLEPIVASSDINLCRSCGKCVEVCEFHAPELKEIGDGRMAVLVNEALCKGCGTCASVCPTGAMDLRHFTDAQIDAQMEAIFKE
jgi:heterodisulfide reductase subunit A-like polyferredoxin